MDVFDRKTNEVDITITAPSDNEMDGGTSAEDEGQNSDYDDENFENSSDSNEGNLEDSQSATNASNERENELCERFDSGVSLNEEKSSSEPQESGEKKPQNYEIVGDRVLVERDGKFELVDANEIKAEYFEMLGIKPEGSPKDSSQNGDVSAEEKSNQSLVRERPKTTPAFRNRDNKNTQASKKRVQSSWGERYRSSEYDKIRSPYGLTEKQLEIKKKREEAIARRKKEEEERQREEDNRKREDAERAFQAWLNSKREEEKERRRMESKESKEEDDNGRTTESRKAFKAWKASKKKQENVEREAATRRMQETASMYVVHDRGACEEAFRRWVKKKKNEKKAKELEKKKRLRPKSKRKPKEPLPINSDKIRFTDNYGYRNTVVY